VTPPGAASIVPTQSMGAARTVALYAAGSLRGALEAAAHRFEGTTGMRVETTFGASGLLRERIERGAAPDVFASANMEHPSVLAAHGWSERAWRFARNRMCLLARPGLRIDEERVLDVLLDPATRIGTSTPRADPSGDYALEVFRRADAQRPGAFALLAAKAHQLTGGPASPEPPVGRSVYADYVGKGRVDVFLTYCTNARVACAEMPALQRVALPASLDVAAEYGLAVRKDAGSAAVAFAAFVLGEEGQRILAERGFGPP